jgi:hypothetical protein
MPKKKKTATVDKAFVRGPDGKLYILSKSKLPYAVKAAEEKVVQRIVNDARKQIEESLKRELPGFGDLVNLVVGPSPFR